MTRMNMAGTATEKEEAILDYRARKRDYTRAIKKAKKSAWLKLLAELDQDEWGQGYKIVVKRTHLKRSSKMGETLQWELARRLFPEVSDDIGLVRAMGEEDLRPFSVGKLEETVARIKNKRAPGPDGVPSEIVKVSLQEHQSTFLNIANEALKEGKFPDSMKKARLVLVPKPAKNVEDEIKYRPISILNIFAKVLEAKTEGQDRRRRRVPP